MASPSQWTWVWVNSGSWWWTGRPGMLWFIGSQRVRHDWATELNSTGLPFAGGFSSAEELKDNVMYIPWGETRTLPPRLSYCFLAAPPFSLHPRPSQISNCLNLSCTGTTALSNSMKLSHARGAIKDRRVMVKRSDRMWSTGEGNANHFSILALRTPWTVWKGKMIGYWKRNSPGQ